MLRTLLVALTITCSGWGCTSSLPPQTDPEAARAGLTTALTSWQNNEPTDALQKRKPPLYFTDLDQRAGRKLTVFKIEDGHELHGRGICIRANLTLQPDGKSKDKIRTYLIEIANAVVIVPGG